MKTNPETGFPERRTIKFGTNCDLSDERKWKPQIQVSNSTYDNAVEGYGDADDGIVGDDDDCNDETNDDIAGDDEAPLVVASRLCGQHALSHRSPDTWHEHHPALHEGDQHDGCVGKDDKHDMDKLHFTMAKIDIVCKFSFIPVDVFHC